MEYKNFDEYWESIKDNAFTFNRKALLKRTWETAINNIPIEPLVIRTNMEYWCEECETICAIYEQGLSCSCGNRWETEVLDPKDYPKKWKKVKVIILAVGIK